MNLSESLIVIVNDDLKVSGIILNELTLLGGISLKIESLELIESLILVTPFSFNSFNEFWKS